MGLFGGSKKSTSLNLTTTNRVDNSNLLAEDNGIALRGSGNRVTTTDFGAVEEGIGLSRDAINTSENIFNEAAFLIGDSNRQTLNTATVLADINAATTRDSLDLVDRTQSDFINLTRDTQTGVFSLLDDALERSSGDVSQALTLIDNTQLDAFSFADQSQQRAFGAVDDALTLIDNTQLDAFNFADQSQQRAFSAVDNALNLIDNTQLDAFNTVNTAIGDLLTFGDEFSTKTIQLAFEQSRNANAQTSEALQVAEDATTRALDFVSNESQPGKAIAEDVVKYAGYAALVFAIGLGVSLMRKK